MYLEAGADGIFPEALQDLDEFARFARDVDTVLLANCTEFGKSPLPPAKELGDMGYNIVIYPVTLQRLVMHTVKESLDVIKQTGTQASLVEKMQTRQELYDVLGYDPSNSK